MDDIDLKAIEKRAFVGYHEDGILEICIGLYILLFGLGMLYIELYYIPIVMASMMVFVWKALKQRITHPRLGYVSFGSKRRAQTQRTILFLVIMGFGAFAFTTMIWYGYSGGNPPGWAKALTSFLEDNFLVVVGVMGGIMLAVEARITGLQRFYYYGAVCLGIFTVSHILSVWLPYAVLSLGGCLCAVGAYYLYRFIGTYPVTEV